MELIFKPIQIEDKIEVLKLFKSSAKKIRQMKINHWQYWLNPPSEKLKWLEEGILNQEYFFVENKNQDLIGMVRILDKDELYWGNQAKKAKYIHSLVVREEYNGKGFGAQILEKIEQDAKQEKCSYFRLDADSKNPKLCSYYENLGFKKVGCKTLSISTYNLYEKEINYS